MMLWLLALAFGFVTSQNSTTAPSFSNASITVFQSGVSYVTNTSGLPAPFPRTNGEQIVAAFRNLGRSTVFTVNATFNAGTWVEAEGMVRVGSDRYFISHNVYTNATAKLAGNGTDRTTGAGYGLITVLDASAQRIAQVNLSEAGAIEYHNGGIDYDGEAIWCNLAQYRPNSTFSLVRVDPRTLNFTYVARFQDHAGAPIHDTITNQITNMNWGSRNATVWNLQNSPAAYPAFTQGDSYLRNPSFYTDYQDCKFLGHISSLGGTPAAFCTGVATLGTSNIGGMAIVNLTNLAPIYEVPFTMMSNNSWPLTQNPSEVDYVDGHLRFWFFPDQNCNNCTLYVVDAKTQSPFQYGGGPAPS